MAFNSTEGRIEYTATTAQTVFPFAFKAFTDIDLKVYLTPIGQDANDTADLLILATDYTVTINGDLGGEVTLLSGATLGDAVTIVRELAIDRLFDYQTSGDLLADTINADQDYQTYLVADQKDKNTLHISLAESSQGVSSILPAPSALKLLGWNSSKTALDNFTIGDDSVFINIYNADTIGSLSSVDANIYPTVNVRGYYTPNDGGGGLFNYDATQSAVNNGGTIINGWVRQYSGAINIKWFGAKGDGITVDTTFIQSAINSIPLGGEVFIPTGEFLVTATININNDNISIKGIGTSSIIKRSGDYGDTFYIAEATNTTWIRDFEMSNLSIETSTATTTGAHIHIDALLTGKINDVYMQDGTIGLHLSAASQINIDNVYVNFNSITSAGSRYIKIDGSSNPGTLPHGGDIFFTNFNGRGGATSQCEIGMEINVCDGLFMTNSHLGNCLNTNLLINGSTDVKCTGALFNNCWFDIGEGYGIQIEGSLGAGVKSNYYFSDCTMLSGGNNTVGAFINGTLVENVFIKDCNITGYTGNGIDLTANFTGEVILDGNRIRSNGTTLGNGINFSANCPATIINNKIQGASHSSGIAITGAKTGSVINNNNLIGNTSSMPIMIGTSISQKDNIGFNPVGQPAAITPGASPYTYTNPYGFDLSTWITGADNVSRNSVSMPGFISGEVTLGPGDSVTLTYTTTPTIKVWGI